MTEQQEEKRQKIVEEVKIHREWMSGTDERVETWREYQKKNKNKRRQLTSDDFSGETDHDKVAALKEYYVQRRKQEEKAYYTALGEEYKINWR